MMTNNNTSIPKIRFQNLLLEPCWETKWILDPVGVDCVRFRTLSSYLVSPEGTSSCPPSGHNEAPSCGQTSAVCCSTGVSSSPTWPPSSRLLECDDCSLFPEHRVDTVTFNWIVCQWPLVHESFSLVLVWE